MYIIGSYYFVSFHISEPSVPIFLIIHKGVKEKKGGGEGRQMEEKMSVDRRVGERIEQGKRERRKE